MSQFRTVRISQPRFEKGRLRFMTVKSRHLRGRGDICIYCPDIKERADLPIAILLHGVYGSSWSWALNAGAHLTAERLILQKSIQPMILAMPSDGLWGDGSGYLPHNNVDFEKWIALDVASAVRENVAAAADSTVLFIGGLSMGGFGALRIGAKYGRLFSAVSGHSAITAIDQLPLFVKEALTHYEQDEPNDESVYKTIMTYEKGLPPIRFDCGKDDILIEYNRALHAQLVASHIEHTYREYPGAHEWAYWEEHLVDTLEYFNQYI